MLRRAPYYVLAGFKTDKPSPDVWILDCFDARKEAARAINWQERGTADRADFRICTFDETRRMFIPDSGGAVDFPLRRGIYTREAYGAFMRAHGIDPKDMRDA